jgi:hypothetical protein
VFNVVTGQPAAIGGELCANPIVRKLSFTGSTAVGRLLMAQCAPTIKKLSLELGGNAPFIVFDDADVDAAVAGAIAAKYRNTGQTCVCANRLLVQAGIYEEFAAKFAAKVGQLQVGAGTEAGVAQGPLINAAGGKVESHVADALAHGARVLCGGARHERGGNFFQPTVLADVTTAMKVAREETFGPVAPLFRFKRKRKPSPWPTIPSSAWPPTSSPATWRAAGALARRWNTAWSASTPAASPTRWRPSAASSNPASGAKGRSTASRTTSKSSISASTCRHEIPDRRPAAAWRLAALAALAPVRAGALHRELSAA